MTPDRIWLGRLRPMSHRRIYDALVPLGVKIREAPCAETAALLTPEGGLGILIREGSEETKGPAAPGIPTLWVLEPDEPLPRTLEGQPQEFLRMPADPAEIVHRVRALAQAVRRERAVERLRAENEQQGRLRQGIVGVIAHDLASPLTAVLEYLEMLTDGTAGSPTEIQRKLLVEARGAANRVVERVQEIVDASRADAGLCLPVRLARTDLRTLLVEIESWCVERLRRRDQHLVVHLAANLPPICADPTRLAQALHHLVEHAHRFSPSGGTIEIECDRDPEATGFVHLSVADPGSRIPPDEMARRFDPFAEMDLDSPSRPCIGISLALVLAIARAHGGRITVACRSREGMRLGLRLPAWGTRAARIAEAQALLAAPGVLPRTAWVCRACGPDQILSLGAFRPWVVLCNNEVLVICENDPPKRLTALGRVGDFQKEGSLDGALQPRLLLRPIDQELQGGVQWNR